MRHDSVSTRLAPPIRVYGHGFGSALSALSDQPYDRHIILSGFKEQLRLP
ncbi:hypothetical protein HNR56_001322 [Roseospira marina]|nr:hypothetical protein [Roseospira marina]MBB5086635.1 hypothetical protein [Roseospira marina]